MSAPPLSGLLEAALYTDDLAAAEEFYSGLLGLPIVVRAEGRHIFFRCGGTILLVFNPEATRRPAQEGALPVPPHGAEGPGHVCFASNDLDDWVAFLTGKGIEVESDFRWPHGPRSVYVRDPAGNSIEFAEPALWEAA
ncbi:VOC family protein [Histidinibacterium aquaticum]|uniref:Glyoxalase/bleomycin resistance/extradiol dioxygenase family protein n=1 Tax=Histidinibacterium aquaticum TaxID=2613962 RepID=A0A5J5GG88_9RHOB|nr:VOC family protein [Histidinibacterium aquaticum]KAA9007020.1 glyoxalase/bleomycin resistance/extradiol dioxygenase family protein [Histidinibacterium aquaticum]